MTLNQGQWMTLTFDNHIGPCTHLVNWIYQLWYIIDYNSFWKIHCFPFFPYKSIMDQIWPCRKIGQGRPSVIIWTNLVVLERPMLHATFQGHRPFGSGEEDFFRVLLYMSMAAILVKWPGRYVTLASCITSPTETGCGRDAKQNIFGKTNYFRTKTKKMHTHTWCFYSQTKKLQAFEVLKWDSGVTKETYDGVNASMLSLTP